MARGWCLGAGSTAAKPQKLAMEATVAPQGPIQQAPPQQDRAEETSVPSLQSPLMQCLPQLSPRRHSEERHVPPSELTIPTADKKMVVLLEEQGRKVADLEASMGEIKQMLQALLADANSSSSFIT